MSTASSTTKQKQKEQEQNLGSNGFQKLWEYSEPYTIGRFAQFLTALIGSYSKSLEIRILVLLCFIVWVCLERSLAWALPRWSFVRDNRDWAQVLRNLMNFMTIMGIFAVIEFVYEYVSSFVNASNLSTKEFVALCIIAFLAIFAVIQNYRALVRKSPQQHAD